MSDCLLGRLSNMLSGAVSVPKQSIKTFDRWWITDSENMPGRDFNRQIHEPGSNAKYPEGALSIMCDEDFWCVAALPLWAKDIGVRALIGLLFPAIHDPIICPDHGDYWWTARYNDDLEVPGEPYELWDDITYVNGHRTRERIGSYETIEEALTSERRMRMVMTEGIVVIVEVHLWEDGQRSVVQTLSPTNITYSPAKPRRTDWL